MAEGQQAAPVPEIMKSAFRKFRMKVKQAGLPQDRLVLLAQIVLSVILGVAVSAFIYSELLVRFFSPAGKRALLVAAMTAGVALAAAPAYFLLLRRWIFPVLSAMRPRGRAAVLALSFLLGGSFILGSINLGEFASQGIAFLLPDQSVEISIPAEQAVKNPEIILLGIRTSLAEIPYDVVEYRGWTPFDADQLRVTDWNDNHFRWSGKIGERVTLTFRRFPRGGLVDVSWGGLTERLNLYRDGPDDHSYSHEYSVPFFASGRMVLLLILLTYTCWSCALILCGWTSRQRVYPAIIGSVNSSQTTESARLPVQRASGLLLLCIVSLALALRVLYLGRPYLNLDELWHLEAVGQILAGSALRTVYQRSLVLVTLPTALSTWLFGANLWAAKLPAVLFNVLAIFPLYLIVKKVNRDAALVACLLYATSPWLIGIARTVREYAYYPFYFYWIVLAMIAFLERFPERFVLHRHWKHLGSPRMILLSMGLLMPVLYALFVDPLSTFKTVLVVYAVFFAFILARFDFRDKTNLALGAAASLAVLVLTVRYGSQQTFVSFRNGFQSTAWQLLFSDPDPQWYFGRWAVPFIAAFLSAVILGILLRRRNFIPMFLGSIFIFGVLIFSMLFVRQPRPRYFSSLELWYIPLLGIGFHAIWRAARALWPVRALVAGLALLLVLPFSVNGLQILGPALYDQETQRLQVTGEYMRTYESVEALLLSAARPPDLLVADSYAKYAIWRGMPALKIKDLAPIAPDRRQATIDAVVISHASGWIVLDPREARDVDLPDRPARMGDKILEYVGERGELLVWHWYIAP